MTAVPLEALAALYVNSWPTPSVYASFHSAAFQKNLKFRHLGLKGEGLMNHLKPR